LSDAGSAAARARRICRDFPEVEERETWGNPTWRVRDRIFLMERGDDAGRSLWMKAPPGAQEILISADPARFFAPPYVGPKGWIGVRVDAGTDWDQMAALVARSYRLIAPRRLAAQLPED
jgi:predicted DNA-binding protein (MmcQ/YjbR family)